MPANPLGLDGIEFIEFASPNEKIIDRLMTRLGMREVARHKTRALRLFRQNDVNFIFNAEPDSFAVKFAAMHGPAATSTGFRVHDAQAAFHTAIERGARPFTDENAKAGMALPAIYGIGDSLVYFVDRYGSRGEIYGDHHESSQWQWLSEERRPVGKGLTVIDHMTNNVPAGEMQKWCDFYTKVFAFEEKRYFDIKGKSTGLFSKVMKSPCGKFSIPINEPQDSKSQIQEYLDEYKGSGIQHIALLTANIVDSVSSLVKDGIEFLTAPPESYYRALERRVPTFKAPLEPIKRLGVLVDGDQHGHLLQIFTKNQVGPIFVEIIQRAGHDGFGDGNFQALFDAMEEDQRQRGVI